MADFLDICGVNVPCDELSMRPDPVGAGVTRAANAAARANWIARKWHGKGKTAPLHITTAEFLTALLAQQGDHWNFDADSYSDKGRGGTTTGTAPTIIGAAPTPKRGAGELKIVSGAGNTIKWNVDACPFGWTVLVWVNINAAGWNHYILTSSSFDWTVDKLVNGAFVNNGAAPAWLSVDHTNYTLQLLGVAGGSPANDYAYDDLVFIPAPLWSGFANNNVEESVLALALYNFMNANTWPLAPKLTVSGDFHQTSLTMLGEVGDAQNLAGSLGDAEGFQDNLRQLQFELFEA